MKVFRQVVESGTFVAAAERLNLSAAMTSKHLFNMERRLGTRLLNRSSRSLSLTESGKLFFEHCRTILDEVTAAELAIGSVNNAPRGTLRVTCPNWMATRKMAELLASYRKRYPEVLVEMSFEDRLTDIIEEGYDVAIRCTSSPPPGLIARRLRPIQFVILGSPDYLERCDAPTTPQDLARHDCVMIGSAQSWSLSTPAGWIEAPSRVVMRLKSVTAAAHAAAAGIGLARLPIAVLEDPQFQGRLRVVLPEYPLEQRCVYLMYISRKHVPPKVRTFIDHTIDFVAKAPVLRIVTPDPLAAGRKEFPKAATLSDSAARLDFSQAPPPSVA
jgi:DNA-binding transcriptional LysR family regulator